MVARPIPQDIIDDSKLEVPKYVVPVCPEYDALDPVLKSIDLINSWLYESWGAEWTGSASAREHQH